MGCIDHLSVLPNVSHHLDYCLLFIETPACIFTYIYNYIPNAFTVWEISLSFSIVESNDCRIYTNLFSLRINFPINRGYIEHLMQVRSGLFTQAYCAEEFLSRVSSVGLFDLYRVMESGPNSWYDFYSFLIFKQWKKSCELY